MKQFIKKFLIVYVIIALIFLSNFNTAFAKQYEKIYLLSLSLQSIISSFLENIKSILPGVKSDEYKEKYFNLLKELAQIKIAEQEKIFLKSLELIKSKYPNSTEVKKISSGFGIIYAEFSKNVKEGSLVVDENWILIGKVRKVLNNYLEIISLNYPGLQFNVANLDGKLIGLANTTGLG
jgi:cell shape-determining protein MreC